MSQPDTIQTKPVAISVARQGVFDRNRRLWGYQLFCVGNTGDSPSGVPADQGVPVSLASSAGVGLQRIISRKKQVLVNLTEKNILDDQVYALPPNNTTVCVTEDVYGKPGVAVRVEQLKADGFPVAVPTYTGKPECAVLYELADIIGILVKDRPHSELESDVLAVRTHGSTPMACLVPDSERYTICLELGFDLFQGSFSKEAEIVPLRKVSSNQVIRFNLLKILESDEPDLKGLAEKVQSDAAISFRLLTYLNSPYFGLTHKVKSIPHAINMLGWNQVRNWLRVVLLSDINDDTGDTDLLLVAAQRAKFLELVANRYSFWGFEPESMHLLGLFSLLDAMIGIPMKEIVSFLPLDGKLKEALCRNPESEYLPLLDLVRDIEEARWDDVDEAIRRLNLDSEGTKGAFQEAVGWADELTTMMEAE